MKIGEVYYWVTDQAKGHEQRSKFHIYVCPTDWVDDHTFLFINKGQYGDDYKLLQADYPKMLTYDSYVSPIGLAAYDDDTLKAFDMTVKGTITKAHLKELMVVLDRSKTMERQQKKRICAALNAI